MALSQTDQLLFDIAQRLSAVETKLGAEKDDHEYIRGRLDELAGFKNHVMGVSVGISLFGSLIVNLIKWTKL